MISGSSRPNDDVDYDIVMAGMCLYCRPYFAKMGSAANNSC